MWALPGGPSAPAMLDLMLLPNAGAASNVSGVFVEHYHCHAADIPAAGLAARPLQTVRSDGVGARPHFQLCRSAVGEANVQLTFHGNNKRTIDGIDCVYVEPDID
jgi:hypothetical protein